VWILRSAGLRPASDLNCTIAPIPPTQRAIAAQPALEFALPGEYNESVEKPYGKSVIFSSLMTFIFAVREQSPHKYTSHRKGWDA
jgi:hypothetical protein